MIRLAVTGSYATGKSTVARFFRLEGVPFFDADKTAHRALEDGDILRAVEKRFPTAIVNGKVERKKLGALVFGNDDRLAWLESLTHPFIFREEKKFFRRAMLRRDSIILSEIPLLFETGNESRYDATIVTVSPLCTMRLRAHARPGMTDEKFESILAHQMPSEEKARYADFVIHTGIGKAYTYQCVKEILHLLRTHHA